MLYSFFQTMPAFVSVNVDWSAHTDSPSAVCGHESRRELWFILPDGTENDSLIQLNLENSEAAEGGIMPALLDRWHV